MTVVVPNLHNLRSLSRVAESVGQPELFALDAELALVETLPIQELPDKRLPTGTPNMQIIDVRVFQGSAH